MESQHRLKITDAGDLSWIESWDSWSSQRSFGESTVGVYLHEELILRQGELGVSPGISACPTLHRSTLGEQKQEQETGADFHPRSQ